VKADGGQQTEMIRLRESTDHEKDVEIRVQTRKHVELLWKSQSSPTVEGNA